MWCSQTGAGQAGQAGRAHALAPVLPVGTWAGCLILLSFSFPKWEMKETGRGGGTLLPCSGGPGEHDVR